MQPEVLRVLARPLEGALGAVGGNPDQGVHSAPVAGQAENGGAAGRAAVGDQKIPEGPKAGPRGEGNGLAPVAVELPGFHYVRFERRPLPIVQAPQGLAEVPAEILLPGGPFLGRPGGGLGAAPGVAPFRRFDAAPAVDAGVMCGFQCGFHSGFHNGLFAGGAGSSCICPVAPNSGEQEGMRRRPFLFFS